MLQSGSVIAQKYRIVQKIGVGGMSTVYLAEDIKLNKKWTVKEIKKTGNRREKANMRSLIDEANLIKKLDHPAIPRIVDIIETDDTLFIVRDFVDGDPMDQVLRIYGAQPQDSVVEWARELCEVLDYLHHQRPQIIYRDMKPANLMLVSDGTLRLIDFGIAREVVQGVDEIRAGTKGYAPPEQITPGGRTDERSDIYALGMTLYQLATGVSPAGAGFDPNRSASDVNPQITPKFAKIIEKCVQRNPDDRYQNCGELRYALSRLETGNGLERRENRKHFLWKCTGMICLAFFAVSLVMALVSGNETLLKKTDMFHWLLQSNLDLKSLFFILALLSLSGYGVIQIRHVKSKSDKRSAEQLYGTQENYVVRRAQKGSMMDMLSEAVITDNPLRWDEPIVSPSQPLKSHLVLAKEMLEEEEATVPVLSASMEPCQLTDILHEDVPRHLCAEENVTAALENELSTPETSQTLDLFESEFMEEMPNEPQETESFEEFSMPESEVTEQMPNEPEETELFDDFLMPETEVMEETPNESEETDPFKILHSEIVVHSSYTIELNI